MDVDKQTFVDFMNGTIDSELTTIDQIDDLIEQHTKAIEDSEQEIELCKLRIEVLIKKRNQFKYGNNTVIYELADLLRARELGQSRAIPFDWNTFNSDDTTSIHYYYFEQAKKIIDTAIDLKVSIRKAIKLATL